MRYIYVSSTILKQHIMLTKVTFCTHSKRDSSLFCVLDCAAGTRWSHSSRGRTTTCPRTKRRWRDSWRAVASTRTQPTARPRSSSGHPARSSAWRSSGQTWCRESSSSCRRWGCNPSQVGAHPTLRIPMNSQSKRLGLEFMEIVMYLSEALSLRTNLEFTLLLSSACPKVHSFWKICLLTSTNP